MSQLLHVGLRPAELFDAVAAARALGIPGPVVEGDGWHAWGERLTARENDGQTMHVVFRTRGSASDCLLNTIEPLLQTGYPDTCVAVETSGFDWSVEDAGGRAWHKLHAAHGVGFLVVEYAAS